MRDCILITGGCGFIGCAVISSIITRDLPIVVIDNLHQQVHPTREPNEDFPDGAILFKRDICDAETWDEVLASYRPVQVLHLAAETGTAQSLTESTRHAMVNVVGTTRMLDAFSARRVRPERIVLTSSRAVYGEGKWRDMASDTSFHALTRTHEQLMRAEWDPVNQVGDGPVDAVPHKASDSAPSPTSVYGATKLTQENVLNAWCAAHDTSNVILRLQNVYGEGQSPHNSYTGIINIFHKIARQGGSIPIYEDGDIVRDFVHIDDVANVILAALDGRADGLGIIDVGTGKRTTIQEAAVAVAEYHSAPKPHICGKFRDGDVRSAMADITVLEKMGVVPSVALAEGLARVGGWLIKKNHI